MINHDLFGLIRRIEGRPGKPARDCAHVVIGGDKRAIENENAANRMMGRLLGAPRHVYELQLGQEVELWDANESIRPFLTNETTNLRFRLQVKAESPNAVQIAEALHHATESPADRLRAYLRAILKDLTDDEFGTTGVGRVGNRILRDRLHWQTSIARILKERTGLTAKIIFEGTPQSEIVEIAVDSLPVSPKDAPHASILISFHATLEPVAETPQDPLPSTEDRRRALVARLAEEAVRREVTLHALWYDPERSGDILRHRLGEALAQTGHRCTRLEIRPLRAPVRAGEQVDVPLAWSGFRGREVTFHLDAIMRLREDGAGRYHAAGQPNRRDWLEENGRAALRSAMHGRDFYDLTAAEQVAVGDRVRASLVEAARAIGHDVDPVAPDVRLPEKRWLTTQVLTIEPAEYPTRNAAVKAEFSASLEIRFRRIRPLVDYIDYRPGETATQPDYNEAIEKAIRALVRETLTIAMKTVESADYFGEWDQWDLPPDAFPAPVRQSGNYVRSKLVHAVRTVLVGRLEAEEVHLQLNPIDSGLGEIERALIRLGQIEVEGIAEPEDMRTRSEAVPFVLRLTVGHVDPGRAAALLRLGLGNLTREAICASILGAAEEFLTERTTNELRELNAGVLATHRQASMKERLESHIDRHMVDAYGFHIRLDKATTRRSLADDIALSGRSIRHEGIANAQRMTRDAMARRLARSHAEAEHSDGLVETLSAAILNNPRRTPEERERYQEDLRELEEARRDAEQGALRLEEDIRRSLTDARPHQGSETADMEDGAAPGAERASAEERPL